MHAYVTDCEGPVSRNDNAYELTVKFVPKGETFFPIVSRIDDVWADNIIQPGYKAGDTLKLILPFFGACGVTNEKMIEESGKGVLLVPGAKETLKYVRTNMPAFIVSTSYRQYISALCTLIGFPETHVYCTEADIDKYSIPEKERIKLESFREEIVEMPMIEIPDRAKALEDFSARDQDTIKRLYEIFWVEIPNMSCGQMFKDVKPVGGWEKSNAIKSIAEEGYDLSGIMYTGDSITDVPAFRLVRQNNGLTVAFNSNKYGIREAEICVMSPHTLPSSILATTFTTGGKDAAVELANHWNYETINKITPELYEEVLRVFPDCLPKVCMITDENREYLGKESSEFRRTVRGEAIGRLG